MAAQFTSADLLSRFNTTAGRPASGDSISDATKYTYLADAQTELIADIAARAPWTLYSKAANASTPTMTNVSGLGNVFTFGTDTNGDPLFPIGKVFIYPSINAIPDTPWVEGVDFIQEGTQIRIPDGGTYSGTLYWRGIAPVAPISASTEPAVIPPSSRILIVYKAVWYFAQSANRNPALADRMEAMYAKDFARWMLVWKTQFGQGGALGLNVTGLQMAIAGTGGNPGPYGT